LGEFWQKMAGGGSSSKKLPIRSASKSQKRKEISTAPEAARDSPDPILSGPEIGFRFRSKSASETFYQRFEDRTVMAERAVNCSDLHDEDFGFIPRLFAQRQWNYFVLPPARPYVELVREFYANIKSLSTDPLRLITFVRGHKIEVTEELISSITGIPQVPDPGYPFPTLEFPSKKDMYQVFSPAGTHRYWRDSMNVLPTDHLTQPVKLLARIMLINIYPLDHHSDLGVPRARFLFALLTDVSIDFPSFALRLMYETFDEKSTSLPFGSLISRICERFIHYTWL
jgi:hypothetical protein